MTRQRSLRRTPRRSLLVLATLALMCASVALVHASPDASAVDITSAGPLTKVTTTPDLNCAVNHVGDSHGEFYGETACGTFVTDGTNLYGPADVPAGGGATSAAGYTAWTPVSQSGPTGSGTSADPYTIVTTVSGGPFTVVQTDTYVIGQESYTTSVRVTSSSAVDAIVYRAGDCYLQGSDDGLGLLGPGNAPTCKAEPGSVDPDRIEQWYPLTPGSNYMVDDYSTVWSAIGAKQPLPDTVETGEDDPYDNGAGLSWSTTLAAGASATFAHLTLFSPIGLLPVTVTKSVTPSAVTAGGTVSYTITLSNPSTVPVPISSVTDHLPDGFAYVTGSTTGLTTGDPSIAGQDLTWSGSFSIPAGSVATPGTATLTFSATASSVPGTYTNSASAVGSQGATVIPATDVAPVTVRGTTSSTTTTSTTSTSTTSTSSPPTTGPPVTQPTTSTSTTSSSTTTTTETPPTVTLPPTTAAPTTRPLAPTTTAAVNVGSHTATPARPVTVTPSYTG